MNEEQENLQVEESDEWKQLKIKEEAKHKEYLEEQKQQIELQIAYTEKLELRKIKLEAFRLASNLKPIISDMWGGQGGRQPFTASDLIREAELIYQSLIK